MMKKLIFATALLLLSTLAFSQNSNTKYDKALADSLGADEYGMRSYILVILKTGPAKIENKDTLNLLFKGHMDNISRLADEGKLVIAGPFVKNDNQFRGIFILNAKNIEEAKEMVNTDPTIKRGIFDVDFYNWYGSAALPVYLKTHEKIEVKKP